MEGRHAMRAASRRLLDVYSSNSTYKVAIIIVGVLLGASLVGLMAAVVFKLCRRNATVTPADTRAPDVEKGLTATKTGPETSRIAPNSIVGFGAGDTIPVPPWLASGQPPPGIALAPSVPVEFAPWSSNPRLPGSPPYERLLLISSRVHQPMKVAEAAWPNVGVVVYDWKRCTLQELLVQVKRVTGPGGKVASIAVVAPGNKPGCVALLESNTTSADKLAGGPAEVAQFWRVLAGCLATNTPLEQRQIHLLGCRVLEAAQEGAALLKTLLDVTGVLFLAADDAVGGYALSTDNGKAQPGELGLCTSPIQGIDLYFDRKALLGLPPPMSTTASARAVALPPLPAQAYAAPLPAGQPPPAALQPVQGRAAPVVPGGQQSLPTSSAQPLTAVPVPRDVFARFLAGMSAANTTASALFARHDKDWSGCLSVDELTELVKGYVPDVTPLDVEHFRAMMDIDGNSQVTLAEFTAALETNTRVAAAVRTGRDDTELLTTLYDYLSDNDAVLRDYFKEADANKNGVLEHAEIVALVACIPGLEQQEKKFIASYLYQQDTSGSGALSLDQLKAVVKAFGPGATKAATCGPMTAPPAHPAAQPSALVTDATAKTAAQQEAVTPSLPTSPGPPVTSAAATPTVVKAVPLAPGAQRTQTAASAVAASQPQSGGAAAVAPTGAAVKWGLEQLMATTPLVAGTVSPVTGAPRPGSPARTPLAGPLVPASGVSPSGPSMSKRGGPSRVQAAAPGAADCLHILNTC